MSQIEVKNVYKIFGKNPKKVIPLLEKGMTKDQIHNKTGYSVGVNNVSFQVNKGEFFVVMGLSGMGGPRLFEQRRGRSNRTENIR